MTTLYAASPQVWVYTRTVSICWLTALDRRFRVSGAAVSKPTRLFRSHAWEASALPLSYTRASGLIVRQALRVAKFAGLGV